MSLLGKEIFFYKEIIIYLKKVWVKYELYVNFSFFFLVFVVSIISFIKIVQNNRRAYISCNFLKNRQK